MLLLLLSVERGLFLRFISVFSRYFGIYLSVLSYNRKIPKILEKTEKNCNTLLVKMEVEGRF